MQKHVKTSGNKSTLLKKKKSSKLMKFFEKIGGYFLGLGQSWFQMLTTFSGNRDPSIFSMSIRS